MVELLILQIRATIFKIKTQHATCNSLSVIQSVRVLLACMTVSHKVMPNYLLCMYSLLPCSAL